MHTEILEALMMISFGMSWPASLIKSFKSKTSKGKSIFFLYMIWFGYAVGIAWKIIDLVHTGDFKYPIIFYIINVTMVTCDIVLYYRNKRLDRKASEKS